MKITINNIPLLASAPVQWALRSGVSPVIMEYDMTPTHFENLTKSLTPSHVVSMRIEYGKNEILNIKNLYYLGNAVGINPKIKKIIVADRRWLWNRHVILRKYNIRRHASIKRIEAIDQEILQPTVPDVIYAKYSLKSLPDGKWKAKEIIEDIINELIDFERDFNSGAPGHIIRGGLEKDIPVENFRVDDSGSSALNNALALIAGADIYIDYNGRIIVYDKSSSSEQDAEFKIANNIIENNNPMMVNFGNIDKVDKSFLRPREVRVMFHREIEVRFDATEKELLPGATTPVFPGEDTRRNMDNVVALSDWTLNSDVQGTWIEIVTALAAWEAELPAGSIAEFSLSYLRKTFMPFLDLWSPFLINGVLIPDKDLAGRISSIMTHWRRTFRINSNWIDRVANLRAYRVATIDQETGQRAPAIAYANYFQLYTQRSFHVDAFPSAQGNRHAYISNFEVGLANDSTAIESTRKPAPARVSLVDEDQGIIHLDFLGDTLRMRENSIPGIVTQNITPDVSEKGEGKSYLMLDAIGNTKTTVPEIGDGTSTKPHVTTVIMTAISASPNDNRQYHVVTKKPGDLKGLPKNMEAKGPPVEVIVGSSIETARVRWLDSRKEDIEKLFGIGLPQKSKLNDEIKLTEQTKDLVINRATGGSGTAIFGSLEEIAEAVAQKVYTALLDRLAGSASVAMDKSIEPRGYMDEVSQEVNPDGVTLTRITSPVEIPELDFFALLDENSRAVIMKLANLEKGK